MGPRGHRRGAVIEQNRSPRWKKKTPLEGFPSPKTHLGWHMRGVGARSRDARAATDSAKHMHTPHAVAQFWGAESDTTWRI